MERVVVPEILDSLPADDPEARRSRADLRVVDAFLGNSRWILRRLRADGNVRGGVVELGAGEGNLCRRVFREFPGASVTGLDLCPRPAGIPDGVGWVRGDFFGALPAAGGVCMGSLVLHHFGEEALANLGARLVGFSSLVFSEPLRSRVPLWFSKVAAPVFGKVTRHDMAASIRAGFVRGELGRFLKLDRGRWKISEQATLRGSLRFHAVKL
ncbi:MAG: hypothetical protein KGR46_05320 [Verrucomicrobia bacterium]|nr:hypothetical protein [Verrucomicrobiota bacterium]